MWKKTNKCVNCPEYKNCKDSFASWIFFIIGIIATVAIRVVTVLTHLNPIYSKIAWYIGVTGFFAFFVYKFRVNQARSRIITEQKLVEKIRDVKNLEQNDYRLIASILCGLNSRKEMINYVFIFGLSAVVLVLAFYMDFIKSYENNDRSIEPVIIYNSSIKYKRIQTIPQYIVGIGAIIKNTLFIFRLKGIFSIEVCSENRYLDLRISR